MPLWTDLATWLRPARPQSAAQELLERVIREERDRSVLSVCWVRFAFGVLNALVVFPVAEVEGYTTTWPSRYGALTYAVLAGALLALVKWKPSLRGFAAWAPAFLDVPLTGIVEWSQTLYAERPGIGAPSSVVMMLAFVVVSVMALSRRVILLVMVLALFFQLLILHASAAPFEVRGNVVVVTTAVGALLLVLVGKLRGLVQKSREKDLLGKYILGERLGAGGMAEVFRAVYSPEGGFERTVAVKRILPSWVKVPELLALFRREAELGARLAHPNVVQVFDFGSDGETYFLAMEFVDGVSLARLLKHCESQGTTLPVPVLLWLTQELAAALQYIHTRTDANGAPLHLVHRDLNPPNIMLSKVGEVKVADFGIARSADKPALTQPGMMRGKLAYAAPEQAAGEALDGRADLFALGITLYEAATGERLFGGRSEAELLHVLMNGAAESPASRRPELPPALDQVVRRLLERSPGARLATGAAVLEALHTELRAEAAAGREQLIALVHAAAQGAPAAQVPSPARAEVSHSAPTVTRPL